MNDEAADGGGPPRPPGDASASRTELKTGSSEPATPRDSRFTPGVVLADRYRIIAPLGRGGMGEVFRVEDLKLGQQVALKFLPDSLATRRDALARLYSEVRLGRQISHPNVCRIYDIAEAEGHHFIAMEYIDGEDLASLLRRIGRLPHDKALDIARDICAGVAAAHGLGVIHRDLKPANIMIDGRGEARITDFGLAAFAADLENIREVAGTPAYMAPEQIEGGEVTQKTDLYSLGLILYEVFTGKRLFDENASDVTSRRRSTSSQSLARESSDMDPAVHRVIVRCLEDDPKNRPGSIHAVIAALPGGDPLQAALDAGETPSPEMVAAAGDTGELRPAVAWPLLAIAVLLALAAAVLGGYSRLTTFVPAPYSPEVLAFRASEMLDRLAPEIAPSVDSSGWFGPWNDYFAWEESESDPTRLGSVRPLPLLFVHRESPRPLLPVGNELTFLDPPMIVPGESRVALDSEGRLVHLSRVPMERNEPTPSSEIDWSGFIEAAGLDAALLTPAEPEWTPPVGSDRRFAWSGVYPGQPDIPMRVEAAALGAVPVWFEVLPPWHRPDTPAPQRESLLSTISGATFVSVFAAAIVAAAVLARRNLRRKRGDRKGAWVIAVAAFIAFFGRDVLAMEHVASPYELFLILEKVTTGFGYGFTFWLFYIALEPYLRRRWPRVLIGWARLVSGRATDPRVGREVLLGVIAAMAVSIAFMMMLPLSRVVGPTLSPLLYYPRVLSGFDSVIAMVFHSGTIGIRMPFVVALLLLLSHALLRNRTAAVVVTILVVALTAGTQGENVLVEMTVRLIAVVILTVTLVRVGLIAAMAGFGTMMLMPTITLNPDSWFFASSMFLLAIPIALAVWGFRTALGSNPVFAEAVLEE